MSRHCPSVKRLVALVFMQKQEGGAPAWKMLLAKLQACSLDRPSWEQPLTFTVDHTCVRLVIEFQNPDARPSQRGVATTVISSDAFKSSTQNTTRTSTSCLDFVSKKNSLDPVSAQLKMKISQVFNEVLHKGLYVHCLRLLSIAPY